MNNQWILILLALLAGAFVPIQTGANAVLTRGLGNGMMSTLLVFIIAALVSVLILIFQRPEIPSSDQLSSIPLYAWLTGGILGTAYIFLLIYLAPRLGMASVVAFVIGGQLLMAMIFDHFGLMGSAIHAINWKRLAGAMLMVIGLIIIKKF